MKLATRLYTAKDYDILTTWWNAHGSYPPKPQHLSATGLIVEAGGNPVCAGFLYKTDSKICVFEFVVSDPNAEKEIRDACLILLIEEIKTLASQEYELIYSSVRGSKYIQRLLEGNFIIADREQTHMFYEVGNE